MILPPDLSIIIVSYQVRTLLEQCLKSLFESNLPFSFEVFVVDNASADGSADFVRQNYPLVQLVANSENCGFAFANNQALRQAKGRYLMLLNPDTMVKSHALETLLEFMDTHPRAGACGPKLLYADGTIQHSAFRFPSLVQIYIDLFPVNWRLRESALNGRYSKKLYASNQPFQIDHPLGAAFLVRREIVEQVGILDESFFIYAEEIDWAMRIRKAGWQIWCVPQSEIVHYEAQSTRQFRHKMFVELWRARATFFRKHYSRIFNAIAIFIVRVGMLYATRNARRTNMRGEITDAEFEQRVAAFQQVAQTWRGVSK